MAMATPSFILSPSSLFVDNTTYATCRFQFVNNHASSFYKTRKIHGFQVRAVKDKTKEVPPSSSPDEITKKYGLEAGLWKVGIATNETGEKVGTFALAYAAHKAASPIRFPPTVALTPIVASWIGKNVDKDN
ncbi:DNA mismatch repair protein MutL [Bienertia sinuspersici]